MIPDKERKHEAVYSPQSKKTFIYVLTQTLSDLGTSHHLAVQITKRDIKATYRQSFLGLLWAFIIPVMTTLIWLALNGSGLIVPQGTAIPYSAYLLSGTMIYAIFSESLIAPLEKTNLNKSIITKVNFPREGIILSGVYHSAFNGFIKLLILLPALLFLGVNINFGIIFLPVGVFCLVLAGTALGMLITPVGILYTDISKVLPLILQFLMYTLPIVYLTPSDGILAQIIEFNPLTPLIVQTRDWVTGQSSGFQLSFFASALGSIILLLLGLVAFRVAIPKLIERISS